MEDIKKESFARGISVVFSYLKKYKNQALLLLVLGIISAIGNGIAPYIVGKFLDAISTGVSSTVLIGDYELPLFLALIILWVAIQLLVSVFEWIMNVENVKLSSYARFSYVAKAYGHLLELPMSFHKKERIGSTISKIDIAADGFEAILRSVVIELGPKFLTVLIAFAIAFYINVFLALVLVAGILVYVAITLRTSKVHTSIEKDIYSGWSDSYGTAVDSINNAQAIKQAGTEKLEQRTIFENFKNKIIVHRLRINTIWQQLKFNQKIIVVAVQLIIFSFSVYLISVGEMTIGQLVAFNAYSALVFAPFGELMQSWQMILIGLINIEETQKVLALPTEVYEPKNKVILDKIQGNILFKNIDFSYDENNPILKNVNFEVRAGEVVALVGESGVGKSTLVDLISGYHFPSKGELEIDGHNIRNIDLRFLRSQIAVVSQEVVLFNDTIKNNIGYGINNISDSKIEDAAHKAHAYDFIEKFPNKWQQIVGERGVKLSGGQKQRVAIARAILRDPKILILDEPTSALDAKSESIIQSSLTELMEGKTTFIIAHRLSTVRRANKILVIKDGTVAESGTHDELMNIKDGEYKKLYELQIGLH